MDSSATRSREQIVLALFDLFRRAGYEGVSIGDISTATGLGRSSLYHHFPGGKADMAVAVVSFARDWMAERLIAPLAEGKPLTERIDTMLAAARELYNDGEAPCLVASMLINRDNDAPQDVGDLLGAWLEALEDALGRAGLADPKKRALDALITIEGALILARATGRLPVFDDALARVRADLISD